LIKAITTKPAFLNKAFLSLVLSTAPAWAGPVSFSDTFSPPSSQWSNSSGSWTATGGDYYAQHPNNNPIAATYLPYDLTSYTLNVTLNSLGDGGIIVRTNPADTQFVYLILGGEGYGQGARGGNAGTSLYWADSNNPTAIDGLVTGVFTPGNTYSIEVIASGDVFEAYVNGTLKSTFTDAAGGLDGEVGLYDDQPNTTTGSGSGPATSFSNFSLTGTTVTTPTTAPEPSASVLMGTGLAGLFLVFRRARRSYLLT
jgi:hypothetical protein